MNTETLNTATEWWLRLREPNVSPVTIAQWMEWCEASPEHEDAFARVQSLWQMAGRAPLKPVSLEELAAEGSKSRRFGLPIAASIAAVSLAGAWFAYVSWHANADLQVATSIGDNRELKLPDGSRVVLGAASLLTTDFSDERRVVRLERGEAFFKVKADKNRPFMVFTSSLAVTAVGTAFNVRADSSALRVTVTEGVVDIARPSIHKSVPIRVQAGQQLTLQTAGAAALEPELAPAVHAVDAALATAWTDGALKFLDEPLGSVISTVNRYSRTAVALDDERLAGLRYTGTVVADRIDEWLAALPNSFPVEVVQEQPDRVLVRPRAQNFPP